MEILCWGELLRLSVEFSRWDQLFDSLLWQSVVIGYYDYLLRSSAESSCWDYKFSYSVVSSCWDYPLRLYVDMICCEQLLRLSVETICGDQLLSISVEIICVSISVEIICGVQLSRLYVEIERWDYLVKAIVAITGTCWDPLLSFVEIICCEQLLLLLCTRVLSIILNSCCYMQGF